MTLQIIQLNSKMCLTFPSLRIIRLVHGHRTRTPEPRRVQQFTDGGVVSSRVSCVIVKIMHVFTLTLSLLCFVSSRLPALLTLYTLAEQFQLTNQVKSRQGSEFIVSHSFHSIVEEKSCTR